MIVFSEMFRKLKLNYQPPGEVDKNMNHFYQHLAKNLQSLKKMKPEEIKFAQGACQEQG